MPRQEIVPFVPLGTKENAYAQLDDALLNFVPTDPVNDEQTELPAGKRTLLIYHNTSGGNENAEVKTVVNLNGRTLDQNFQLNAADAAMMGPFDRPGFFQTAERKLFMISSDAALEVAVIQLP